MGKPGQGDFVHVACGLRQTGPKKGPTSSPKPPEMQTLCLL